MSWLTGNNVKERLSDKGAPFEAATKQTGLIFRTQLQIQLGIGELEGAYGSPIWRLIQ